MIENQKFKLTFGPAGELVQLLMKEDPHQMNWVIDENYLERLGYPGKDKLFGHFELKLADQLYTSQQVRPTVEQTGEQIHFYYAFESVTVKVSYDLAAGKSERFDWTIELINQTTEPLAITDFGVWLSLAYVMFRDKEVAKNIHDSAAVFPAISTNYTKVNAVRRDNEGANLGLYQVSGETRSIGTYCEYENLFFENVSPSLDGLLFHKLILAGGYPEGFENRDWIYSKAGFTLEPQSSKKWQYAFVINDSQADFYQQAFDLKHPKIEFEPLTIVSQPTQVTFTLPDQAIESVRLVHKAKTLITTELTDQVTQLTPTTYQLRFTPETLGEHQLILRLADGTEDFVVFNVMDDLANVIEERAAYICDTLYNGASGSTPYAFEPISNQGESLGKLTLVLKKNLLGDLSVEQVRKVEASAVNYVRPKWFIDGDFKRPRKLYGEFYRPMDFEYIGHLFLLLSEFDAEVLQLNDPVTYLQWTADVFNLRVNPDLHEDERGKEEAQMLGVYFLYIQELLEKLKHSELQETYQTIKQLWEQVTQRVNAESATYRSAITEHFYDNAGFGPSAGALSEVHLQAGAERYGQLLLANIGYSNDFRAQNPDRWWEALTYMIHSLWGGVTAAATYKVYEFLKDPAYLEASYRATAGILYCYDTHSTTTLPLAKGMAASTYAVAGPHLNRLDLSRERFGQATFFKDGGIFARLFENDTQTPDWDMGEELVAYLDGFGQKTFILKDAEQIRVINGSCETTSDGYLIKSFAPYCQEFVLIEAGNETKIACENPEKELWLKKGVAVQ